MTRRADVDEDDEAVLIYRGIFLGHKKKETHIELRRKGKTLGDPVLLLFSRSVVSNSL